MWRYLGYFIALFAFVGLWSYSSYIIGKSKGRIQARRWAQLIEAVVTWRQEEMKGNFRAAELQLNTIREIADREEDQVRKELRQLDS